MEYLKKVYFDEKKVAKFFKTAILKNPSGGCFWGYSELIHFPQYFLAWHVREWYKLLPKNFSSFKFNFKRKNFKTNANFRTEFLRHKKVKIIKGKLLELSSSNPYELSAPSKFKILQPFHYAHFLKTAMSSVGVAINIKSQHVMTTCLL